MFDFNYSQHVFKSVLDYLVLGFYFGETICNVVFYALCVELLDLERDEIDTFVFDVLDEVKFVQRDFVQVEHCVVLVYVLIAELYLFYQHVQKTVKAEIQTLLFTDFIELFFIETTNIHGKDIGFGTQLHFEITITFISRFDHYSDCEDILDT